MYTSSWSVLIFERREFSLPIDRNVITIELMMSCSPLVMLMIHITKSLKCSLSSGRVVFFCTSVTKF